MNKLITQAHSDERAFLDVLNAAQRSAQEA